MRDILLYLVGPIVLILFLFAVGPLIVNWSKIDFRTDDENELETKNKIKKYAYFYPVPTPSFEMRGRKKRKDLLEVRWSDLRWPKDYDPDKMSFTPPKITKYLGKKVEVLGYVFSLDWSKKEVFEFLLMPFLPACMHIPMPPPDQVILVKAKKPVKWSFRPIMVEGILEVEIQSVVTSGRIETISKITDVYYSMEAL